MRKKILFIVLAVSILMMSSYAMAFKPDSPPGLSNEKNANAPGQFKKTMEFESQEYFLNEIHSRVLLSLDQREVSPQGLIGQVIESITPVESLPPVAVIICKTLVYKFTPVYFYANESFDPDGGDIILIEWDINGDGIYENIFDNENPYLGVFEYTGIHSIGLRVTDDEERIGTAIVTVTVIE